MENYIFFFIISLIVVALLHYCYETIKSSIIYCNNYTPKENYKFINDIINEDENTHQEDTSKNINN